MLSNLHRILVVSLLITAVFLNCDLGPEVVDGDAMDGGGDGDSDTDSDSDGDSDTDTDGDTDSDGDSDSDTDGDSDSDVGPDSDPVTGTDSDTAEESSLLIESFPPVAAEVGRSYRYRVVVREQGEAEYTLAKSPDGAKIDTNGNITWVPKDNHKSVDNTFEVSVRMDMGQAKQVFDVKVAAIKVERSGNFPSDQQGSQSASVDSPTSSIRGTTVIVPSGAIKSDTPISIGSVEDSAPLPSDRMSSSNSQSKVVDFGPSGLAFSEPLTLLLPLSDEAKVAIESGESEPAAWTMGNKGVWESQPIKHIDLVNGVLVVETKHFSQFASTALVPMLSEPVFSLGGTNCAKSIFASVGLTGAAIAQFSAEHVNGLPDGIGGASLAEVGAALANGAHLQIVLELELVSDAGDFNSMQHVVFNLHKFDDGKFDVIVSDRAGGTLHKATGLSLESAAFANLVGGSAVHSIFPNVPDEFVGGLDVRAFAYFRSGEDSNGIPVSPGQQFAHIRKAFEVPTVTGSDDDCDRLLNSSDPTPQGVVPPILEIDGESVQRTLVDMAVDLKVKLAAGELDKVDMTWSTKSDGATLTVDDSKLAASFSSPVSGFHRVEVTAANAGGESRVSFELHVDKPVVNKAPDCEIVADNTTVYVDEAISLKALPFDEEQADEEISVTWVSTGPDTLSTLTGRMVSFQATEPSEYTVSCVANDGTASGIPGSVVISVIERPVNIPPELLFATPMSGTIEITDEEIATEVITARAVDPDGHAVSFEFNLLEGSGTLTPETPAGEAATGEVQAARLFQATAEGAYSILIRARDEKGATSDSLIVKLLVVRSLDSIDDDEDGYPASIDCVDNDGTVYPGAREICGDEIDQNCSGADKPTAECDLDGDGFSEADGDCDESHVLMFPGALERCNNKDDNCDGSTDEGFLTGDDCVVGKGACSETGAIVCSKDGSGTLCNAKPGLPSEETCNGVDNDCNGMVDDVATDGVQSVQNCGGCGNACVAAANQVPACEPGPSGQFGCFFYCAAGFLDLDRDPTNGCEYQCTATGNETCDGIDNDCDGVIDENTEEFFYNGPVGTTGVGQCHGGSKICVGGNPVVAMEEVTPQAELCDGMDNDCDGQYDEDFELGVPCDGDDYDYCDFGFTICSDDMYGTECMESYVDVLEICDGEDNDCNPETPDGVADELLGTPCDEGNQDFCEPGFLECIAGGLECIDDDRDQTSCVDCNGVPNGDALIDRCGFCGTGQGCDGCLCDIAADSCGSNGSGFFCTCDKDCDLPEGVCPCDEGAGCDLVDGVAECPCDEECVGLNPCPCDQDVTKCDETDEGWACVCDKRCFDKKCDCDTQAEVCDGASGGDTCLCDRDCYPPCFCDDGDDLKCAVDADGHICECDLGCEPYMCACNTTEGQCDPDPQGGDCLCDADCEPNTCACNVTPETCDVDTSGGTCFCDGDCFGPCFCDDGDPNWCAMDSDGNDCHCDQGCDHFCNCDDNHDFCDADSAGGLCFCDWDCEPCECDDGNDQTCAQDGDGNPCHCDKECQEPDCDCNVSGACDTVDGGGPCECDHDCGDPPCDCNSTEGCDTATGGGPCFCDYDCGGSCFCDDEDPEVCATDADGNHCHCDEGCFFGEMDCSNGNDDDGDGMVDCGDPDCDWSPECGPPCYCNTSENCDVAGGGGPCFCDWNCQECLCDDGNDQTCAVDGDGNICKCDPGCEEPPCDCNVSGGCDTEADGGVCDCDYDCGEPPPCNCDLTANCDSSTGGGDCFCDHDCDPGCFCDDGNPDNCAHDSDGNPCPCDQGCNLGEADCSNGFDDDGDGMVDCEDPDCGGATECGPMCNCDSTGECDTASGGGPCFCDWNCQECLCDDGNDQTCAVDGDGNPCKCDPECEEPQCDCNMSGECDTVADGGVCDCDYDCGEPPPCNCDLTASCDSSTGGGDCFCDHDCDPGCFCDDGNPDNCVYDTDGNQCPCDEGCYYGEDCFNGYDDDGDNQVDCADPDCDWAPQCGPMCNCDSTGECDTADGGGPCFCDWNCQPCLCNDDNDETCAVDGYGNICKCDPGCAEPPCDCNMSGACDTEADGGVCDCDYDCGEPSCDCDSTGSCDSGCFCDKDCDSGCFCDDGNPDICAHDTDGNQCPCDQGCYYGEDCFNGYDDDGDNQVDCADPDCDWAPQCGPMCNCDSTGECDTADGGGPCFCDWNCQPCLCNDDNDETCAVDGYGNICKCDPGCAEPPCDCNMSGACDTEADGGVCDCDYDCGEPSCDCDSTGSCDSGCFCDKDCDSVCFCDDGNPDICAHDTDGNQCPCDQGCYYGEMDCSNAFDDDGDGCVDGEDHDCGGYEMACNDGYDDDCDGMMDCGDPDCDMMPECGGGGEFDCYNTLDDDSDGCVDGADHECGGHEMACNDGYDNDCDGMMDCGDPDCNMMPECGPTCDCNTTSECDTAMGGGACFCDFDCQPCPCNDENDLTCAVDGDGNTCKCDPGCEEPVCDCNVSGACDTADGGGPCECDYDCAEPACNCDSTASCDMATGGGDCFCDKDCDSGCFCDDGIPEECAYDTDGNQCPCDEGCYYGEDCYNGYDDDGDDQVDCADPDCNMSPNCTGGYEFDCYNFMDDDADGCVDGADYDCGGVETMCSDLSDDDCDGLIDCEDPDCESMCL